MCDSPILQTALSESDTLCKCPHSGVICNSHLRDAASDKTSLEVRNLREGTARLGSYIKSNNFLYRFQLEQDVRKLQQQLREEMELHTILENAIEKNALQISTSSCLPRYAQELLTTIAELEVTVSKLEQEMVSLHFQLSQERNERRLAEYRRKHPSPQLMSPSLRCSKHSTPEQCLEDSSYQELRDQELELSGESVSMPSTTENAEDSVATCNDMGSNIKMDSESCQPMDFRKLPKGMPPKGLWDNPNQLSEQMVRCMKNIFMSLADSAMTPQSEGLENNSLSLSPRGHLSNSSWWSSERSMISSWVHSPHVDIQSNSEVLAFENVRDPYRVRGKLSWAEIGNYGLATEVSWMSVGKKQLEYAAEALRKFRVLVEQLAKVNPIHLNCNERLAFWINLYNALIMHAYLAYGVPRSELKLFSLMQKAAYTVGGHSFSAAAIEYVILKMKPPLHRPQIALLLALHKVKVSEEQRKSAMSTYEPLVAFGLSCGMYSSPAVRIYTARNVREELEEAQLDFIRASVGISSKGRLLVPKMLHCFAKCFVDDANLGVWISHYLPPHQAAFVEQCISKRRQSLLGSRNCGILPFDSRFRYLFLPDKFPLQ
ncbi:Ternary complex factor MIP1, leucine-zipper [Parasponia andersonii]|uniref:Ternary complex factor MIP1, leucine-zipper n=1 Tax=Parasponia andersonii TaxID=3476 RepID=A0A2P5AKR2_PARAD|nr:Ternary complex factor MIP1, leucine-zipper [Parasponia andersonii]